VAQFAANERSDAAGLLDAMLLLNEEQVATSIRSALDRIAERPRYRKRRVALYAEREFDSSMIFDVKMIPDRNGRLRRRAVGYNGPPAVRPVRGRARVGSEGFVSHLISQSAERWTKIFMNHPGPDRLRGKTAPAGEIVIVTDFLGSGTRVSTMLDKFWAVPTVRSWTSRGMVRFRVVAAAATPSALGKVRRHRLRPQVEAEWIAPTVTSTADYKTMLAWKRLIDKNGPEEGRGTGRYGFGEEGALIAFNYRLPNNTPAMVHHGDSNGWQPLYVGSAPVELRGLFGVRSLDQAILSAADANGVEFGHELTEEDRQAILVLSMLKGRWHRGAEVALASRTSLPVPTVLDILTRVLKAELITRSGRLTDKGYKFMESGRAGERKTPVIATSSLPYYPETLRIP
tara:strand:+ start:49883 stop:51085 length:1203 start_codon:yes stop_codon:yes gene_type:complete